jgi:hypothetical protein
VEKRTAGANAPSSGISPVIHFSPTIAYRPEGPALSSLFWVPKLQNSTDLDADIWALTHPLWIAVSARHAAASGFG